MKKLAFVLIGVLALTTVQAASSCNLYVELAAEEISNPPYPGYFGAGEEYFNAAECFSNRGEEGKADPLYLKAANYYKEASSYLLEDGDYYQAALSHERAAKSYESIGRKKEAVNNYEEAIEKYNINGDHEKAEQLKGKIEQLQKTENTPEISRKGRASFRSIIGLFSLITLFVSLLLISLIIIANLSSKGGKSTSTPIERTKSKDYGSGGSESTSPDIETSESIERESSDEKSREESPEERAIRKLRDKYRP